VSALCVLDGEIKRQAEVGYLCGWHRDRLDFLAGEIETLWFELAITLDGSGPQEWSEMTRRRKASEMPTPINLSLASMRDLRTRGKRLRHWQADGKESDPSEPVPAVMVHVAMLAARLIVERPLSTRPTSMVAQLHLLTRHHDWIAGQQHWICDYAEWLEYLRKILRRATHDKVGVVVGICDLPTDNGECGGDLLRMNGSEVVRCLRCRESWSTPEHRALLAKRLGRHAEA
jgi:hypothetical protein